MQQMIKSATQTNECCIQGYCFCTWGAQNAWLTALKCLIIFDEISIRLFWQHLGNFPTLSRISIKPSQSRLKNNTSPTLWNPFILPKANDYYSLLEFKNRSSTFYFPVCRVSLRAFLWGETSLPSLNLSVLTPDVFLTEEMLILYSY